MTFEEAREYAMRAARSAMAHIDPDSAEDVAHDALTYVAQRDGWDDMARESIAAAVRIHAMRRVDADPHRAATRDALSIDLPSGEDGATLADMLATREDAATGETVMAATIGGLYVTCPRDAHGPDISRLTVRAGQYGSVIDSGPEALARLHATALAERRGEAHGAAKQAVRALTRDAAVLATEGMPWAEALAMLAEQGYAMARGAYRVALMRARNRQAAA